MAGGGLGLFSCSQCIIWDGGYPQAEFQITFQDATGQPVEGVELRVEDYEGHNYFHYPVTDYLPGQTPTSDQAGLMVFHHVSSGIEFSGRECSLFFVIPIEERRGPRFLCRFLRDGAEVHRIDFRELAWWEGQWWQVPKVTRRWKPPDWPPAQLLMKEDESCEAWHARAVAFFDVNGNGRLDPEEAAAFHAADRRAEEAIIARSRGVDQEEEMVFPIVRRTITIKVPGQ